MYIYNWYLLTYRISLLHVAKKLNDCVLKVRAFALVEDYLQKVHSVNVMFILIAELREHTTHAEHVNFWKLRIRFHHANLFFKRTEIFA